MPDLTPRVFLPSPHWQCRERWLNHLDPSINKGEWTEEEDQILLKAQAQWGNSWTKIAELLPGR
jgi:hypothetical protein